MKVLHMVPALDGGGIARLLYDYCSRITPEVQFDFTVTSLNEGILEEPLKKLGCKIFRVKQVRKNFKEYCHQLEEILNQGNYDVVHTHADYRSFFDLYIAKKCGVRTRIVHSHLAYSFESSKDVIEKMIFTPLIKIYATDYFACSKDAAIWTFGKKYFETGKVYIMKNAIKAKNFTFSETERMKLRKEMSLNEKLVLGDVARFCYQKNHDFLIDIFSCVAEKRDDAVLLLAGRGELLEEIKEKVKKRGLSDKVLFLGVRNDIPQLLNAMDVFVLPTRYEGLGIVYVEAQANGLPCYATADVVPEEVKVCDNFVFVPKEATAETWADIILSGHIGRSGDSYNQIVDAGYEVDYAACRLKEYYLRHESN